MSARKRVEDAAKKAGLTEATIKNLTNVEVWNLIKDKTGKEVPASEKAKDGEVLPPTGWKAAQHVPSGANVAFMMPAPSVTLLPTAAPFNPQSAWYVAWAISAAFVQWVQPYLLGALMGVLFGGQVLRFIGVTG